MDVRIVSIAFTQGIKLTSLKVFYAFSYGSAGWLALQAVPLVASPTMVATLLSPEVREPTG